MAKETIGELLAAGRLPDLVDYLLSIAPAQRRKECQPLVSQAKAILKVSSGSTVKSWLRDMRDDYPGGREQFENAWKGNLKQKHWDAATVVLLAAKDAAHAAKVWPTLEDARLAQQIYPALFPDELSVIVEQWSADFAKNPRNWDRNRGRGVMYEWVEAGLVEPPTHPGAVLMLISGWTSKPGHPMLRWLLERPKVTHEVFARLFSTQGVKGASLAQTDQSAGNDPLRRIVVPGLMKAGVWSRDFVVEETESALGSDLPAYQRRWFAQLAKDLGLE